MSSGKVQGFVLIVSGRSLSGMRRSKLSRERLPNNGMHPTAISAAPIVSLRGFAVACAAGDAGR
jgi:hypothetical protein